MGQFTAQHRALWWSEPQHTKLKIVQYVLQRLENGLWNQVSIFPASANPRMFYNPDVGGIYRISVVYKNEGSHEYFTYHSNTVYVDEYNGQVQPYSGQSFEINSSIVQKTQPSIDKYIGLNTHTVTILRNTKRDYIDNAYITEYTNATTAYIQQPTFSVQQLKLKKQSYIDPTDPTDFASCTEYTNSSVPYITLSSYVVTILKGEQIGG